MNTPEVSEKAEMTEEAANRHRRYLQNAAMAMSVVRAYPELTHYNKLPKGGHQARS